MKKTKKKEKKHAGNGKKCENRKKIIICGESTVAFPTCFRVLLIYIYIYIIWLVLLYKKSNRTENPHLYMVTMYAPSGRIKFLSFFLMWSLSNVISSYL